MRYDYTVRSNTISPSTGNTQAANLALQTATPWPPYSSNTAIPGNGMRMVSAVNKYEGTGKEGGAPSLAAIGAAAGAGAAVGAAAAGGGQ